MKKMIGCMFSFVAFSSCWAAENGMNYDPAHSQAYTTAQTSNNLDGMIKEIKTDLGIADTHGFKLIKTFYSGISTVDGKKTTTIAKIACPLGFKLMLGVYEFDPSKDNCANWCDIARQQQVQYAIDSVNEFNKGGKNCIIGIAVGNEDVYNWDFTVPNTLVQKNIAADIQKIKDAVGSKVKVGTAQQDGGLLALSNNDPEGIIPKLDFIGANIYPYWSRPYTPIANAQQEFNARFAAIQAKFPDKEVIVTEEGWPSQGTHHQNPGASVANETKYYTWWKSRSDNFDSYYFTLFDKQPTNGDADKFFGLFKADRSNKIPLN